MEQATEELKKRLQQHKPGAGTKKLRTMLDAVRPTPEILELLSDTSIMFSSDTKMLRRIAEIFLTEGDSLRPVPFLERALALDESHLKTRRRLARCYLKLSRWQDACVVLEPAVRHPRATWHDSADLAVAHSRLGNEGEHLKYLRRAHELHPQDAELRERLIHILRLAGHDDEASKILSQAQYTPKLTPRDLLERMASAGWSDPSRFVVNIGCRDGKSWADPCFELFTLGYAGVAVDAGDFPAIFEHLPQPEVKKLLNTKITPHNVVDVLRGAGTPTHFDFLNIDIDSFDGALLDPILQEFKPAAVHIEVNYEIPPPIQFAVEYHPEYRHGCGQGFWGCSLSYVAAVGRRHGYCLLQVDWSDHPRRQDAVIIRQEFLKAFGLSAPPDERTLFDAEPCIRGSFNDIGIDSSAWRTIEDPQELLARIREACIEGSRQRNGEILPFVLTL